MRWSKIGMFAAACGFTSSLVSISIGTANWPFPFFAPMVGGLCIMLFCGNLYMYVKYKAVFKMMDESDAYTIAKLLKNKEKTNG